MRTVSAIYELEPGDCVKLASGVGGRVVSQDTKSRAVRLCDPLDSNSVYTDWTCHPAAIVGIGAMPGAYVKVHQCSQETKPQYPFRFVTES